MTDSIFSKIIRGEAKATKVYEDEHTIAILDVAPLSPGHTLVIPKEPAETMSDLSDDAAAALGRVLPRISRAVLHATGTSACNILQNNGEAAGQVVPHVHMHIIPKPTSGTTAGSGAGEGLAVTWNAGESDPEALADLGRQIARLL